MPAVYQFSLDFYPKFRTLGPNSRKFLLAKISSLKVEEIKNYKNKILNCSSYQLRRSRVVQKFLQWLRNNAKLIKHVFFMIMIHHYGYNDKSMTHDAMIGAMTFKSVQEEMLRNCKRKKILSLFRLTDVTLMISNLFLWEWWEKTKSFLSLFIIEINYQSKL